MMKCLITNCQTSNFDPVTKVCNCNKSFQWGSNMKMTAKLWYLHCLCPGDTIVFHQYAHSPSYSILFLHLWNSLTPGCKVKHFLKILQISCICFFVSNCITGDPLHSRALAHSRAPLFTQPCSHCSHSRAPGEQWARLCVFTLHGCVQAARLCRGSPVCMGREKNTDRQTEWKT